MQWLWFKRKITNYLGFLFSFHNNNTANSKIPTLYKIPFIEYNKLETQKFQHSVKQNAMPPQNILISPFLPTSTDMGPLPAYNTLSSAQLAFSKWDDIVKASKNSRKIARDAHSANTTLLVKLVVYDVINAQMGDQMQQGIVAHIDELHDLVLMARKERRNAEDWITHLSNGRG